MDAPGSGGELLGGRAASSANADYVVAGERGITVMDEEESTNFLEERGADNEAN